MCTLARAAVPATQILRTLVLPSGSATATSLIRGSQRAQGYARLARQVQVGARREQHLSRLDRCPVLRAPYEA